MFGHHDVTDEFKSVSRSHPTKRLHEAIARGRKVKEGTALITTARNEVQMICAITTFEPLRHRWFPGCDMRRVGRLVKGKSRRPTVRTARTVGHPVLLSRNSSTNRGARLAVAFRSNRDRKIKNKT